MVKLPAPRDALVGEREGWGAGGEERSVWKMAPTSFGPPSPLVENHGVTAEAHGGVDFNLTLVFTWRKKLDVFLHH